VRTLLIVVLAFTFVVLPAGAQTVRIDGGPWASSVSNAIDLAIDGDTILMSTGTFYEVLVVSNKDIAMEGGYDTNLVDRPGGNTFIDAQNGGTALWFMDSSCRVDQVHFVHGGEIATLAGGGSLLHRSHVDFINSSFSSNAAWYGGGIFVGVFSTARVFGLSHIFTNTAAVSGGGILVDGRCEILGD